MDHTKILVLPSAVHRLNQLPGLPALQSPGAGNGGVHLLGGAPHCVAGSASQARGLVGQTVILASAREATVSVTGISYIPWRSWVPGVAHFVPAQDAFGAGAVNGVPSLQFPEDPI